MPFHLDSPWGATLCRLERVRWTGNSGRVGKNSGPVLSRLPNRRKMGLGARFVGGGYTPDFITQHIRLLAN